MLADGFAALEATQLARTLRGSVWLYPAVNAAHLFGIAALFGAILPLDLRLLGLFRGVGLAPLARVLVPVAASGLAVAILAGLLLFVARAGEYASAPLFQAKMLTLAVAVANLLALRLALGHWRLAGGDGRRRIARGRAAISLGAWSTMIVLGRLVGYF